MTIIMSSELLKDRDALLAMYRRFLRDSAYYRSRDLSAGALHSDSFKLHDICIIAFKDQVSSLRFAGISDEDVVKCSLKMVNLKSNGLKGQRNTIQGMGPKEKGATKATRPSEDKMCRTNGGDHGYGTG